jgi:hypothetical protein
MGKFFTGVKLVVLRTSQDEEVVPIASVKEFR